MTLKKLYDIIEKALADGIDPNTKVVVDVDNGDDLCFFGVLVSAELSTIDSQIPALIPIDREDCCKDEMVFGLFGRGD